ncbi:MAG: hypothetical protein LBL72_04470 [Candidatus Accumulibacter sp.]|nr:hypothetical protein [Accumulibacter sp.]
MTPVPFRRLETPSDPSSTDSTGSVNSTFFAHGDSVLASSAAARLVCGLVPIGLAWAAVFWATR